MNLYQPTITGSLSVSGSVNISGSITIAGGGTISGTASIATTALTASSADNLLVRNTLTAQTLVVQTITSSVDFVTGSTRFGSISANTHVFTGSLLVSGSTHSIFGNVVLGNTSSINANAKLEVKGDLFLTPSSSLPSILHLYNRDSTNETYIYDSGSSSNSTLIFAPAGSTKMVVSSNGNVGIGTTNPSYLLDVRSSASSGAPIVGNFQSAGGDAQLYVSNGSVTTQLTADNTNSISIVGSYTNHPLVIRTNNAERMRIASGGGVKIFGNLESLILQATTVNSEIYLGLYNSAGSRRCYIGYGATPTTNLDFWNAENGDIKFGNNNTEKWRIASTGRFYNSNVSANTFGLEINGSSTTGQSYGIITYAGTNGSDAPLVINNLAGTRYFTVRGDGVVTKPLQPAFNAGKNTNSTVSAGATVIFQLTTGNKFNVGGHYNASTGIFTAPVAGIYDFSASIIWMNVPNGTAMDDSFWIYKNGDIVAYGLRRAEYESTYTGNGGYYVDFANVLLSLAVGDTVKVVNNRTLEIHGNTAYSYFQGYMLG
jgi:hypothetical protein